MRASDNPGRVAGLWYLLLALLGPLRLLYIPGTLFVPGDAAGTVVNIVAHERLFRLGMAADLFVAVALIPLTLALYRLFEAVDRHLAVLVVILGGVLPSVLHIVNVVTDAGALMIARDADVLAGFDKTQRDAVAGMFLALHDELVTVAQILWGAWLLPLAALVYRSGFLPRFLGIWLALNGIVYVIASLSGILAPAIQPKVFAFGQPALMGELALILWLLIRGARPPLTPGIGVALRP